MLVAAIRPPRPPSDRQSFSCEADAIAGDVKREVFAMSTRKRSPRRSHSATPTAGAPDLQDLRKRLSSIDLGPELLSRGKRRRPDWFGSLSKELTSDEEAFVSGHPEEVRVERWIGSSRTLVGRRFRELNHLLDGFSRVLPEHLRCLWFEVDRLLQERKRLECALYYNAGVERGLDLATTKRALKRSGVRVEHVDADALFALSVALADVARRLPFRARPDRDEPSKA